MNHSTSRHTAHAPAPTVRRTVAGGMALLVALIITIGAVSFGAVEYQRRIFNETSARLADQMALVIALEQAIFEASEAAPSAGTETGAEEGSARHQRARASVHATMDRLEASVSPAAGVILRDVRSGWEELDGALSHAPDIGSREESWTQDEGPSYLHRATYAPIEESMRLLRGQIVADLDDAASVLVRVQRILHPIVLGVLGLALAVTWFVARRINRRVVRPLVQLQEAARALGESEFAFPPDMPGATAELRALGVALNGAAQSLRLTHRTLQREAETDPLTGLLNRKGFRERIQALLTQDEQAMAIVFIDLDDFKVVNDSHGHAAGDELLQVVAKRLLSCVREGDVVGRLGGDEFAAAVRCQDAELDSTAVARRMLAELGLPVALGDITARVGASVGVAVAESAESRLSAEDLMRRADAAMYEAKTTGKNQYAIHFEEAAHESLTALRA